MNGWKDGRTVGEGSLDHDFMEEMDDAWQDVPGSQELLAELHELGDRVVAVPDELVQLGSDKRCGFGLVELESSGKSFLGERADLVKEDLVLISGKKSHGGR